MRLEERDIDAFPPAVRDRIRALAGEAAPKAPAPRRAPYRRRPTAARGCSQGACARPAARPINARAEESQRSLGIAFAYVAATVCAGLVYGWTHAVRALLGALVAAVPVWPGWWAAAVVIGAWYVAKRVWGDLDAGGPASKLGRLLGGFAVLVGAMTVCFGLMSW